MYEMDDPSTTQFDRSSCYTHNDVNLSIPNPGGEPFKPKGSTNTTLYEAPRTRCNLYRDGVHAST